MTPERWQALDSILQQALERDPPQRGAFVREACGADAELQREAAALLAVHDAVPSNFLERPAAASLGFGAPAPTPARVPHRMVTARAAVYAAAIIMVVGVFTGWALAHWSPAWRSAPARFEAVRKSQQPSAQQAAFSGDANDAGSLTILDRTGRTVQTIAADRPWTPRFSPDGRSIAYGAFGPRRQTSDIWIADVATGAVRRLTDDDADSNDPQWSPDGSMLAYSVRADGGKDVAEQPAAGGPAHVIAARPGTQFPSDWLRDGALLVTDDGGGNQHDVIVQPADGSPARPYAATSADELEARVSPDERWIAYTSDESGRAEVYLDSYPQRGLRVMVSRGGGVAPVWRGDGRELYYWRGEALVAVPLDISRLGSAPAIGAESVLFHAPYQNGLNTMYDVSPDGQRFVMLHVR